MKTLSQPLTEATIKLHQPAPWLALLDIVVPNQSPIYLVNNTENITFQGRTYIRSSFVPEIPKQTAGGEIQPATLRVENVTGTLVPILEAYAGAVGAAITVTLVNAALLTEDYAELTLEFDILHTAIKGDWITFTLGAPNPILQEWPPLSYGPMCQWARFFKGAECGYTGPLTTCAGTIEDCRARGNSANFGGHRGLNSTGVRLA